MGKKEAEAQWNLAFWYYILKPVTCCNIFRVMDGPQPAPGCYKSQAFLRHTF